MRKAYVLIETLPGKAETVAEMLRRMPGVIAADVVSGPHHVIAVVEGKDASMVARITLTDIPTVDGISHTTTCLVMSREPEQGQCRNRLREASPVR